MNLLKTLKSFGHIKKFFKKNLIRKYVIVGTKKVKKKWEELQDAIRGMDRRKIMTFPLVHIPTLSNNNIQNMFFRYWIDYSWTISNVYLRDTVYYTSRGGSRVAATSKMEYFVIIVNDWKPLTIITKQSILDVAATQDPPLTSPIF